MCDSAKFTPQCFVTNGWNGNFFQLIAARLNLFSIIGRRNSTAPDVAPISET